ncbi:ligase-associated DNA damage response endonuclease PdeM [Tuwongella immobilis]|uniref:Dead deah box helicase: ICC-like phosphoesterase-like protein n=1 Tax=Tuwongella immobilis TaxID=692036 RepID=A0A6C2YVW3_9BACT|nr:ligase-associated DNA damage response endonuclease PdeM [Tuwongella immobilis]VIP05002.1 dead deah box helicase : ICC-like phosphoesterase-like protein OS=Roseiflexus sp. (strain RS-1) GN=RoseRS_3549 PE=4 SV=1 [Tuwongella immobilis]VTS07362.1 dead deah box helicase : ICC-like phosphoesterase-like protein OS=Roseiflexus sp. (strain RS-1) GN=RoseRS_3549 PE=4 SV=1 [Tuwongella immobilis]
MPTDVTIPLAGEIVWLLPERALFWPRTETLMIADLHLGKAATFRQAAIAVPEGITEADLDRLSAAITRTGSRRLVILGDLIHAKAGRSPTLLQSVATWRDQHPTLEMLLVRGNHDRGAGDPPAAWNIRCVDDPTLEAPFWLCHIPQAHDGGYALAGHWHPSVRLRGAGGDRLTLPCFYFAADHGVLPAFTRFSGKGIIEPAVNSRVFVIADDEVLAVQ